MSRFTALIVSAVFALSVLAPTMAQAQSSDPRFFSQTSFRVDNDAFWDFFQHRGRVGTFGYPVSRAFKLDGFTVQIFQREVLQLWPDGSVHTLNLLDSGLLPYTTINGSTFPASDPALTAATPTPSDPAYGTKIIQFVQEQAPNTFEGEPVNFGQTFLNTVTAQDSPEAPASLLPLFALDIWGAPTSKPTRDPTNHNFIYQRFQRSIMHYDKTCGCTQGLLLADYLKAVITTQNLPADLAMQARASKFFNQYAPGQPRSVARPAELPNTDLTNAFDKQQPVAAGSASAFAYGFQVQMWNLNPQAKGFVVGDVKQAGFGWIKEQIEWQAVETAPAQYDFTELDSIVNAAASGGLRVLLSVAHAPTFYRSTTSGLMPADVTTFGRFMQALASRYHGRVQAYELWNEENLAREAGQGNVDPSTYLPLLEAGYTGTKAGDPSALALLGALSPTGANVPGLSLDDLQYLQALFAINNGEVKGFYDAVGAHLSGFSNPPDCMPTTPQCSLSGGWNTDPSFFAFYRLSQYEDTLVRNGDATKTIWLTEFGYDSNPVAIPGYEYSLAVSEDAQARFLVQALQMARQRAYIGGVMIWNLNFQTVVPQTDEKWGFGVIRLDWSARPAYSALAALPKG